MKRFFRNLIFATAVTFIGSGFGSAEIVFSVGANATGTVTNSENFESYDAFSFPGNPFLTASGFIFDLPDSSHGGLTIQPGSSVALPTKSLYQNAGAFAMTSISLTFSADIDAIQLDIGNGYGGDPEDVWIRAYDNGVYTGFEGMFSSVPVGTFTVQSSGTAFDEIRVQSSAAGFLPFTSESDFGAASIDNLQVFSASSVPEPSSLALAGLGGIGLIVGAIRR